MALRATKQKRYTPGEYLALEEKAEFRSEFVDGYIFEMSGGTENHNTITLNIASDLRVKLRGKCKTFAIDVKVWIAAWNTFVYPDIFLICSESLYFENRKDILTNPALVIEVLSDGTRRYDKREKFLGYQTLDSLKEYILVDQNTYLVEQFVKESTGVWKYFVTIGAESEIVLRTLNETMKLSEIYDLVEFENN